jgi:hypothetical protein
MKLSKYEDYARLNFHYMARTDAVGLVDDNEDEALLSEAYGKLIETYQAKSNVARVKAVGIGEVSNGSMVFSRFQNSSVEDYGTARGATKGDAVIDDQVTVNLSNHKEIVEELEEFDIKAHGVGNLIQRRSLNHALRMQAHLDRAALAALKTACAAYSAGANATDATVTSADYLAALEAKVVMLETTSNDYVDGIPREMIVAFVSPSKFSLIKSQLDTVYAYNGNSELIEVPGYHGFQIVSEHYLPTGTDFIITVVGNIAQPIHSLGYTQGGRIPLTKSYEVSLFFDYGVGVLAADLIYEGEFDVSE